MTVKKIWFSVHDLREPALIKEAPATYRRVARLMHIETTNEAAQTVPDLVWLYDPATARIGNYRDTPQTYTVSGNTVRHQGLRTMVYSINLTVGAPFYEWFYDLELDYEDYMLGYVDAALAA